MRLEEEAGDRQLWVTRVSPGLKAAQIEAHSHRCQRCGKPLEPYWDENDELLFECPDCMVEEVVVEDVRT